MNYTITTLDQLRPILLGFRKSRGLTQAGAAAGLGIAQQTYAQLEANPGVVSVERLFRVLRVLGVDLVLADVAHAQSDGATSAFKVQPVSGREGSGKSTAKKAVLVQESRQKGVVSKPAAVTHSGKARSGLESELSRSTPKKREVW
jgi:HTH-type transcriptional regulator/antitoxin HipB